MFWANAFLGCFVDSSGNDYRLLESPSWIDTWCDSSWKGLKCTLYGVNRMER